MEAAAPPRQRPHDSLSMPVVPGPPDGEYAPPAPQPQYVPPQPPPQPPPPAAPPRQPQHQQQYAPPPRTHDAGRASAAVVIDQTNERFELRMGSNIVGRGSDADLQLLDQGISRRHLDIQFDGNFATAYDLGSTNGTAVNGHEVGSQVLRHGDVIRLGHTRLVFHQGRA
jgi:pSer/pThr/pTyr-binding forkhead associated (FHA) protein